MSGTPMEPQELREARRLVAEADDCKEWGHKVAIDYSRLEGEAVCSNGCGRVFTYVYRYTKEI